MTSLLVRRAVRVASDRQRNSLLFLDRRANASDASSSSFKAIPFGREAVDRYLVIGVNGRAAGVRTITSVTVTPAGGSGVAATVVKASHENTASNTTLADLYIVAMPTGGSGDIDIVFSATFVSAGIGVWRMTNLASPTPLDTDGDTDATGGADMSAALDIAERGPVIATQFYYRETATAAALHSGASRLARVTESNAAYNVTNVASNADWDRLNKDFDQSIESGGPAPQAMSIASWSPLI